MVRGLSDTNSTTEAPVVLTEVAATASRVIAVGTIV